MFHKLRLLLTLNKAAGQYQEISKEVDRMKAKHLFLSKTFWLNVLGLVLTVSDVLPPKWAAPIIAIANIANRLLTNQPATLL